MLIVLLMLLLFLTACETVPEQSEGLTVTYGERKAVSGIVHTVRYRGETLALIAAWYAQEQSLWPKLLEVNPGINPKSLQIADEIFIPENLLKQRTAMPASFVQSQGGTASYPKSDTAAPAKKVERTTAPVRKSNPAVTTAPTSKPAATAPTPVGKASAPPTSTKAPEKPAEKPVETPSTVTTPVVPLPALFGPREG